MPLDGARTGAPGAVRVADRFHLWQNLTEAADRCVAVHRSCLAEPEPLPPGGPEADSPAGPEPSRAPRPEPAGKCAERARRHHAMVHELLAQGHGIRTVARHLGWGRHTVQRYARAATWQELVPVSAPTPSSRRGASCANSAAAPGMPDNSPRPSTSSLNRDRAEELGLLDRQVSVAWDEPPCGQQIRIYLVHRPPIAAATRG